MIVRFRQTARRLQVSLIAGRREGAKVRQEHVASLGSVPRGELTPADRIAFWTRLHQRLDALSNRVDATQRYAILTTIHARIPMPAQDDQQAIQLEHAQEDVRFWTSLENITTEQAEQHKGLLATVQHTIASCEEAAAAHKAKVAAARDRLARVEKGEAVAGIPRPMTRAEFLTAAGLTESEAQHLVRLAEICDEAHGYGRKAIEVIAGEGQQASRRAQRKAVRQLRALLPRPD